MEGRLCPRCQVSKPNRDFYTRKRNGESRHGRLECSSYCKECLRNYTRKHLATVRGKLLQLLNSAKRSEIKRGISCSLSYEDLETLWNRQQGRCAVTNVPLTLESGGVNRRQPFTISLDRIDSDKGYDSDNIQFVAWAVNQAKGTGTMEELYSLCELIINNRHRL